MKFLSEMCGQPPPGFRIARFNGNITVHSPSTHIQELMYEYPRNRESECMKGFPYPEISGAREKAVVGEATYSLCLIYSRGRT